MFCSTCPLFMCHPFACSMKNINLLDLNAQHLDICGRWCLLFFNAASAVCSFLNKTLYVYELKMLQWQNNNKASKLQFTLSGFTIFNAVTKSVELKCWSVEMLNSYFPEFVQFGVSIVFCDDHWCLELLFFNSVRGVMSEHPAVRRLI